MAITAVVHVDDIFAVGKKERWDRLCADLNRTIPVKNLGDLKWGGGCRYSRDRKKGTLTISQQSFAEELVNEFRVTSVQSVPLKVGVKMEDFDENEETENWPFRELVGSLMRLAILTRPDISDAVRSVARYCSAPKAAHWKSALGILAYINGTCGFGITYQRGTTVGNLLRFLPTQTTPVEQPTGGLCQAVQLCVQVDVCVGFLGGRNVSPPLLLKQSMSPLATQ